MSTQRIPRGVPIGETQMADSNAETNIPDNAEILFKEPYEQLLPEFKALKPDEIVLVNLDIPTAVATVLGAGPEIRNLLPQMEKDLPGFDLERIRKLDQYAMAISHAHTLFLIASQPPDNLQPLVDEGTHLRETLFTDASALVQRGFLNGARLKDLKGPKGYKNLAVDLQILAALFRESFPQITGKTGTTQEELLRAEQLAARILRAVGLREQGTALIAETSDIRARAFTLFTYGYDQARRAVTFLRWNEDDIESISPSLYTGRGGRKRAGAEVPEGPVPSPSTSPAPGSTAPAAGGTAPATGAGAPTTPGAANSQPFLS